MSSIADIGWLLVAELSGNCVNFARMRTRLDVANSAAYTRDMLAGQVLMGLPGNPFGDCRFGKHITSSGCRAGNSRPVLCLTLNWSDRGHETREYQGPYADDSTADPEAAQTEAAAFQDSRP